MRVRQLVSFASWKLGHHSNFTLSLYHGIQWNRDVGILKKFSSLATPEVTTSGAASDENFFKMTFLFQWYPVLFGWCVLGWWFSGSILPVFCWSDIELYTNLTFLWSDSCRARTRRQGSFCVWAQPMRDHVTLLHRLTAEPIHRMIPEKDVLLICKYSWNPHYITFLTTSTRKNISCLQNS